MTADTFEQAVDAKKMIAQAEQVEKVFATHGRGFNNDKMLTDLGEAIIPFKDEILKLIASLKADAKAQFEKL